MIVSCKTVQIENTNKMPRKQDITAICDERMRYFRIEVCQRREHIECVENGEGSGGGSVTRSMGRKFQQNIVGWREVSVERLKVGELRDTWCV